MRERTLLFGALGATAIAAIYGVTKLRGPQTSQVETPEITPVSMLDSTLTLVTMQITDSVVAE